MKNLVLFSFILLSYVGVASADAYWNQPVEILVQNDSATAIVINSSDTAIICRGWFKAKTKRGKVAKQKADAVLSSGEELLLELHSDWKKDPFVSGFAKVKCRFL